MLLMHSMPSSRPSMALAFLRTKRDQDNTMLRTTSGRIRWILLSDYCMRAMVVMLWTPMSPAAPLCGHLDLTASILLLDQGMPLCIRIQIWQVAILRLCDWASHCHTQHKVRHKQLNYPRGLAQPEVPDSEPVPYTSNRHPQHHARSD